MKKKNEIKEILRVLGKAEGMKFGKQRDAHIELELNKLHEKFPKGEKHYSEPGDEKKTWGFNAEEDGIKLWVSVLSSPKHICVDWGFN